MPKELIQPPGSARPGGSYSPCLKVGDFIFVSGQGPVDPDGNIIGEFRASGYLPSFLDEFITYGLVEDGEYL